MIDYSNCIKNQKGRTKKGEIEFFRSVWCIKKVNQNNNQEIEKDNNQEIKEVDNCLYLPEIKFNVEEDPIEIEEVEKEPEDQEFEVLFKSLDINKL